MEPVTHTLPGSQRGPPPPAHVRQPIHLSAHEGLQTFTAQEEPPTRLTTLGQTVKMSRKLPCLTSVSYLDTHLASLARVLGDDVACVMRARSQLQHLHKGFCRSGRREDGLKREEEEEGGAVLTLPPPFAKRAGRRQLLGAAPVPRRCRSC